MRYKSFLFLVVLFLGLACFSSMSFAQISSTHQLQLKWKGVMQESYGSDTMSYISLESAEYETGMPVFCQSFPIYDSHVKAQVELGKVVTAPLSQDEMRLAESYSFASDFELTALPLRSRNESCLSVKIVPFRRRGDNVEKLVSASLTVTLTPDYEAQKSNPTYAQSSAMASGNWYKIGLQETGVYKLTYSDLSELGVDVAHVDPRQIRMYHNGGGVLPEMNSIARHDDLVEIPIYVYGESDGKFDNSDYILFYGRGPVCWSYNETKSAYVHEPNPYDDYSYAFVVTGLGAGKRISEVGSISSPAEESVSQFLDYKVHESDDFNLFSVGRTYYGDKMDLTSTKNFDFSFPNVVTTKLCKVNTALAGRNLKPASFDVMIDNVKKATYSISVVTSDHVYGYDVGGWVSANPTSETVHVTLRHNAQGNSTSEGYVDYIIINAWRNLSFVGGQMSFRNPLASINNKVYEYKLSNASQQVKVWNVTDPVSPSVVKGQLNGNVFSFRVYGDTDNEFIAFNGSSYCPAKTFGKVDNQNLHGIRDVDFVILTYGDFMPQAERLKELHNRLDPDLNIFITTPELVYNEFSCGAKDISAIRDFCRMLYLDSTPGRKIKYLLLLGDCSYDYKNRTGVVDFVPTFETVASLSMMITFVTDDFFGFMDAN